MQIAVHPPRVARVNCRAIAFVSIILFLGGWPVYTYFSETFTHGIHDRGGYKEVDLRAIGFFQFDSKTATLRDVPAAFRALDGQKVLLTGLVKPFQQSGPDITDFELLYSESCQCGFSGLPQVQEKVFATAAPGAKLRFDKYGYYEVMGRLQVTMKKDHGEVIEVYHLYAESMKPVQ